MAKADDIEHYCRMIKAHADSLYGVLTHDAMGYLPRLEQAANAGGFATRETEEAMGLMRTAADLRGLADRLELVRDSLIMNERSNYVGTG
jgi:hypothetical protein